jgi:hypothetical protein
MFLGEHDVTAEDSPRRHVPADANLPETTCVFMDNCACSPFLSYHSLGQGVYVSDCPKNSIMSSFYPIQLLTHTNRTFACRVDFCFWWVSPRIACGIAVLQLQKLIVNFPSDSPLVLIVHNIFAPVRLCVINGDDGFHRVSSSRHCLLVGHVHISTVIDAYWIK